MPLNIHKSKNVYRGRNLIATETDFFLNVLLSLSMLKKEDYCLRLLGCFICFGQIEWIVNALLLVV